MAEAIRPFRRFALVALLLAWPLAAPAQEIGTVALSVASVTGTPPNGAARALAQGTAIFLDEVVATAAAARAEFLFLDQSSLSMGENTQIVLDRFVFDPNTGAGEMALSLTRGALRFIGGKVSDGQPALVMTPTATIGIRGSSAIVTTNGSTSQVVFVAGNELCLTPNGSSTPICTSVVGGVLTEQGFIGQIDPQTLTQLLAAIDAITAAGGSLTDLNGIDLTTFVPTDVVPFSTSGGQNSFGTSGPNQGGSFGNTPSDGPSFSQDAPEIPDDTPPDCEFFECDE